MNSELNEMFTPKMLVNWKKFQCSVSQRVFHQRVEFTDQTLIRLVPQLKALFLMICYLSAVCAVCMYVMSFGLCV